MRVKIKSFIGIIIITVILCACTVPIMANDMISSTTQIYTTEQLSDVSSKIDDQIVIIYNDSKESNISDLELTKKDIKAASSLTDTIDVVNAANNKNEDELIEELNNNENVSLAFKNFSMDTCELPNDYWLNQSSSLSAFYNNSNIDETWDVYNPDAEETVIAVIDSGAKNSVEDLSGRVYDCIDLYASEGEETDDAAGHGTMVTSTAVATTNNEIGTAGCTGLANVKVLPYRIGGADKDDSSLSIACGFAALQDIYDNHPEVDVINMSFGFMGFDSNKEVVAKLQTYIDKIAEKGIIMVASAGNWGSANLVYPASCDNVISVASVNTNGERSSFSCFNNQVDLAATGEYVPCANMSGSYSSVNGTSFSSPAVAGACAYLLNTTGADPETVVEALENTATNNETGKDIYTGYGIIQLDKALESITGCELDFEVLYDKDEYYIDDTVTFMIDGSDKLEYIVKVNNNIIEPTGEDYSFKVSEESEYLIEIIGKAECGAQKTKTFNIVPQEKVIPVTGIKLSTETAEINIGDTLEITAEKLPTNTTDENEITWLIDDNDSIEIISEENGKIEIIGTNMGNIIVTAVCGDITAECNVTINPFKPTVNEEEKIITGIKVGQTVRQLKDGLYSLGKFTGSCVVKDSNGNLLEDTDIVQNGLTVEEESEKFIVIVYGDINKDSKINISDLQLIYKHMIGETSITDESQAKAADIDRNSKIGLKDYQLLYKHMIGEKEIQQ